jgi:hypothetical protein
MIFTIDVYIDRYLAQCQLSPENNNQFFFIFIAKTYYNLNLPHLSAESVPLISDEFEDML